MRFSTSAVVLGALAASTVNAASIAHENKFVKRHNHAIRHAEVMERAAEIVETEKRALNALNAAGSAMLTKVGSQTGTNLAAAGASGMAWLGADGQFTNEFVNQSGEDLVLAIWGPAGSWVNANKPQITVSIPNNSSQVVSFGNNWSGAWSPVYGSTTAINGQIFETWGEATFKYVSAGQDYSTVDVSREVNMQGRNMKIVTPSCTSDMNTCVFKCKDATASQCMYNYDLFNCAPGSQTGANYGLNFGAPSGGCTGFGAKAQLKTYLG